MDEMFHRQSELIFLKRKHILLKLNLKMKIEINWCFHFSLDLEGASVPVCQCAGHTVPSQQDTHHNNNAVRPIRGPSVYNLPP